MWQVICDVSSIAATLHLLVSLYLDASVQSLRSHIALGAVAEEKLIWLASWMQCFVLIV
jgi:hypothetical protein